MIRLLTAEEAAKEPNYYFIEAIPKGEINTIPEENVISWLGKNGWSESTSEHGRHFRRGNGRVSFFYDPTRGVGMNVAGAIQPVMDEHHMRLDAVLAAFRNNNNNTQE